MNALTFISNSTTPYLNTCEYRTIEIVFIMKKIIILLFFSLGIFAHGQRMFSHEGKIQGKENYSFHEFTFMNSMDGVRLSGTLIAPKTSFQKIVIIVAGSGKDTRHSHYKLATSLLENNIAVYRFDERGVGISEGQYTWSLEKLTEDISYCIRHLKSETEFKSKRVGFLGHSLGGMASATATVASHNSSTPVDFLIQIASPVKNFSYASKHQIHTLPHNSIPKKSIKQTVALLDTLVSIAITNKHLSNATIRNKGLSAIEKRNFNVEDIKFWSPSHISLYKKDYESMYRALQVPTMFIIGDEDQLVNPSAETRFLKKYNNPFITVKEMAHLNHYLTVGTLESNAIYAIDTRATKTIIDWLQQI